MAHFNVRSGKMCSLNRARTDLFWHHCLCTLQVSFSESGSLGNSSGSDVTSLSSHLPDTPNSMVPSPVETWDRATSLGSRPSMFPPLSPVPCMWPAHHSVLKTEESFRTWRGKWHILNFEQLPNGTIKQRVRKPFFLRQFSIFEDISDKTKTNFVAWTERR